MSDASSSRRPGRCSRSCEPGACTRIFPDRRRRHRPALGRAGLAAWLDNGFHGEMDYMAAHGMKRARPAELVAGHGAASSPRGWTTCRGRRRRLAGDRVATASPIRAAAVVSIYARGRDYHKVLRQRLRQLAERLAEAIGPFGHRVFTDSAPVLEVELAARSGIGWRGKHTLAARPRCRLDVLPRRDLRRPRRCPRPRRSAPHCGSCSACIDVCPTQAIVAPYRLDARRCISYLTIEHEGRDPGRVPRRDRQPRLRLRRLPARLPMEQVRAAQPGRRLRRAARRSTTPALLELWAWSEDEFLRAHRGSAIRRIGFERWQRNLAVALGNALAASGDRRIVAALRRAAKRRASSCASTSTGRWSRPRAALSALPA